MNNPGSSETVTQGIRVKVEPEYVPEQSTPEQEKYLFAYKVTITNEGKRWAKLLSRHWEIINADGDEEIVDGPGVVGYTPDLDPGESFEYTSFCTLDTCWGTMQGYYRMSRDNDEEIFLVNIARFYLFNPVPVNA
ncbi:MAG: Co2+/Mg2+ efflux protein ApaG [Ignavibacteriae bacterium]|nr:MAG: Co2+/Mg2+ efflux protein ApaG [Ignavibacteriota bacterium]